MREIIPINHNGSIQLKFSVSGKRYGFNPIPGGDFTNRRDIATAKAIATNIQNDILAGIFDPTLNRYRLTPKTDKTAPNTLLQVWDLWVASLGLPEHTLANHYKWVRRMLTEASPGINDLEWLI